MDMDAVRIGVVGLGYVGLPLAVEFGKRHPTLGFDIKRSRIGELRSGVDHTREIDPAELQGSTFLRYTDTSEDLSECNVYIITVPTPIDLSKRPDLRALITASETVGRVLNKGDVVVYESTVYPGCTEEVCVPVLERRSGLELNRDFFVGYSPERINPGDREHSFTNIRKVVSGSTPEATEFIDQLYGRVIPAGTYVAPSIRVAEAAKAIENTQRDVNIALVNEFAVLFERLGLDTQAVLAAAATKWNFLPFRPGLVGGHCIGVDPYYLTHKAQEIGYHPEMILAGRRVNDRMGAYVAERLIKLMTKRSIPMPDSCVLLLGLSFKENCPDLRNTRVIDILRELKSYNARVEVYDPWVDSAEAEREYGIALAPELRPGRYDGIVLAVPHRDFMDMGPDSIRALGKPGAVLFDVKGTLPAESVDGRL